MNYSQSDETAVGAHTQTVSKTTKFLKKLAIASVLALAATGITALPAVAVGDISGVVTENGTPVSGLQVTAYSQSGSYYNWEDSTTTDASGSWSLAGLPDGQYTLFYRTANSSAQYAVGESQAGNKSSYDDDPQFSITAGVPSTPVFYKALTRFGGAVTLKLTSAVTGNPLTSADSAEAELWGEDTDGNNFDVYASANAAGDIRLIAPAGTYVLYRYADSFQPGVFGIVTITQGQTVDFGINPLKPSAPTWLNPQITGGKVSFEGEAKVGTLLSVKDTVSFSVPGVERAVLWYADGKPLAFGPATTYLLTSAEVNKNIYATVYYSADGYNPTIRNTNDSLRVRKGNPAQASVSIVGSASVGKRLTAQVAGSTVPESKHIYQWYRNGSPITDASGLGYTVTKNDINKNLTVSVTFVAQGYDDSIIPSAAVRVAKDSAKLKLTLPKSLKAKKKTKVKVSLTAGVSGVKPTGKVVITVGKKKITKTVTTKTKSSFNVTLPRQKAGKVKISAKYNGSGTYKTASVKAKTLRVKK